MFCFWIIIIFVNGDGKHNSFISSVGDRQIVIILIAGQLGNVRLMSNIVAFFDLGSSLIDGSSY